MMRIQGLIDYRRAASGSDEQANSAGKDNALGTEKPIGSVTTPECAAAMAHGSVVSLPGARQKVKRGNPSGCESEAPSGTDGAFSDDAAPLPASPVTVAATGGALAVVEQARPDSVETFADQSDGIDVVTPAPPGPPNLAAEETDEENVARATSQAAAIEEIVRPTIEALEDCEHAINHAFERALNKKKGIPLHSAFDKAYTAICRLEEQNLGQSYLGKVRQGVENPYQPYLKKMTEDRHGYLRDVVCKRATIIAVARHQKVSPQEFPQWQKNWSQNRAREEWGKIRRAARPAERKQQRRRDLDDNNQAQKIMAKCANGVVNPACTFTRDLGQGLAIVIIDVRQDGSWTWGPIVETDQRKIRRRLIKVGANG